MKQTLVEMLPEAIAIFHLISWLKTNIACIS